MPIKFKNPQTIDQAAVHALEEQLGFGLTDDYTKFLSTVSNGGSIDPVVFADDLDIGVVGFLGIGTEHYDLATRIAEYSGELPYGLIPIADTEGGNLICIKVSGVGLGSIWFWDHEFEGDAAARKVADSLDEFIAGLREYEDDDPEPQVISSWVNPEFLEKLKRDGLIK